MANRQLRRFTRALIASIMSILLVLTPLSASVVPGLGNAAAVIPTDGPGSDTFSKEAHAHALLQLGLDQQGCEAGEARAQQDTNGTIWFLGGCLLGLLAVIGSYVIEPSPPASALVGQDAAYIAEYTDCYRNQAQRIQQRNALYGCLTAGAVYGLTYALLIAATVATSDF